jgi:acyl-CoA thioester hydrolase
MVLLTEFAHAYSLGIDADFCRSIDAGMATIRHEIDYLASGYAGNQFFIADWVTSNDQKLRAKRRFQILRKSEQRTLLRCESNYVFTSLTKARATRMLKQFISQYCVLPSVLKALSGNSNA